MHLLPLYTSFGLPNLCLSHSKASFLIFDLGVDWRYGAAHFEELLLDYDPCSNWGNWVPAAC